MTQFGIWMITNLFDLYIYRRYLEVFVGRRRTSTEVSVYILLVLALFGGIANLWQNSLLNLVVAVTILSLYSLQYNVSHRIRAIAVIIFIGIIFITEPIGYLIHQLLIAEKIHDTQMSYFFLAFIFEIIRMILVEFFCALKRGKEIRISNIPKETAYILYMIPFTSIVSCILIIEIAKQVVYSELITLCMTIIFTIIASNYLMFSMVHRFVELTESRKEAELLLQESAYKEAYYRDMEISIEQIHNLKHDMKNQLLGLYDLISDEQSPEAKKKLKSMVKDVADAVNHTYSANTVINSILKIKAAEAQCHGIKMEIETFVPKKMNIDVGDYGVLYGNLLDNAIEASIKVEPSRRYIRLKTKYRNGMLFLMIINSKEDQPNPHFHTTKEDTRLHGRGIHSVKQISENYGGSLVLKDHGEEFEANLLLTGIVCLE